MRNLLLFSTVLLTLAAALYIGMTRFNAAVYAADEQAVAAQTQTETPEYEQLEVPLLPLSTMDVPEIGRIQVLNGTNIDGAGKRMFDFLRDKKFDVKGRPENAALRNYPSTMIISRTPDMTIAREVDRHLKTGKVVLIRNNDPWHDVTVIVGWDFEEIAKREKIR
jgi:hypothetical protein